MYKLRVDMYSVLSLTEIRTERSKVGCRYRAYSTVHNVMLDEHVSCFLLTLSMCMDLVNLIC